MSWRPAQNRLEDQVGEWWFGDSRVLSFPKVSRIDLSCETKRPFYTSRSGLPENDITRLKTGERHMDRGFLSGPEVLTRWERATETFHHYS